MLTRIEPEKTGPITTYAPSSMAFTARAFATCGCDCVSLDAYSTLRPRMPPAALISFTASFTPSLKLVPDVAPVPDSSISPTILTDWAWASSGSASARLRKKAEIRVMEPMELTTLRYLNSLWVKRQRASPNSLADTRHEGTSNP